MRKHEGEKHKMGYGFAWYNYEDRTAETLLVPFNILFRWARELYIYLAKPVSHSKDKIFHMGYSVGYETAEGFYLKKIKTQEEEWSRLVGLAILKEREKLK